MKSHFRRLFQKEVRHIMEVSHSPLNAKPNAVSKPTPIVIERGGGMGSRRISNYRCIVYNGSHNKN